MQNRLLVVLGIALTVLFVVLPACQAAPGPGGGGATPPQERPQYGGILRIASNTDFVGFDNHLRPINAQYLTIPMFSNLVQYDATKRTVGPDTIVPDLATEWSASPDGLAYTFKLQRGVKWHDGKPFTADDVVYSLDKMVDPKRSTMAGSFPAYKSAQKVDDYTVRVDLKRPQPSFLVNLAQAYASMQAKHLAGTDPKSTAFLVGTGPFKYKKSAPGVSYELEKNPDYFGKARNGDKLPYLDGVTLFVLNDRSAMLDAVITKRADMTDTSNGVISAEEESRLKNQAPATVQDWNYTHFLQAINFNFDYKPLQDVRVRKALTLVVDREKAVVAGFSFTKARFADSLLFGTAWGMPAADAQKIIGWDRPFADRVAEAKKLLADAGYASGLKMDILTLSAGALVTLSTAIADSWRTNLNVQSQVRPLPSAEVTKERLARNFNSIRTAAYLATAGDPDEVLPAFRTGAPENLTHYSNPQVDKLIDQQATEMDVAKRKATVREIERLVLSDYPLISEGFSNFGTAYWPYLKGWVRLNANYGSHQAWAHVWIDKSNPSYAGRQ